MTATVEVVLESSLPPDRILAAAYDFSAKRPDIWKNVKPDMYTVHSLGETAADVTEGGRAGPLVAWERCDYDWSTPGRVKATVTDSNVYTSGESSWEISAIPFDNGSRVTMTWVRGFRRNPTARFLSVLYRVGGKRIFTPDAKKVIANIEESSNG